MAGKHSGIGAIPMYIFLTTLLKLEGSSDLDSVLEKAKVEEQEIKVRMKSFKKPEGNQFIKLIFLVIEFIISRFYSIDISDHIKRLDKIGKKKSSFRN